MTDLRRVWILPLAVAVLASTMVLPATVSAQTNVSGGQFRKQNVRDDTLLRKGRFELMISVAGNISNNTITPQAPEDSEDPAGPEVTQRSTYLNPNLIFGYMLNDWLELRALGGFQLISNSVTITPQDDEGEESETSSDTTSILLGMQALAQKDFVLGIAGYVGVGGGYFFGSRSEPDPSDPGKSIDYSNSGGLVQGLLGLLMQPGPRLIMRGGLRTDLLFGSEEPENEELGVASDIFNVQVVAEFGVGLRF